jgi:rhodanese-related sulfurtransferase
MKKQTLPIWVWLGLGVLVAAGVLAAVFLPPASKDETLPPEISAVQAAEKRATGAFILDVREQAEWDELHIPGAALIPLGELQSRLDEVPRDREIVVVCRSGNRSATGRDILLEAGFQGVTSMAGGVRDWQAQGFPTATGP